MEKSVSTSIFFSAAVFIVAFSFGLGAGWLLFHNSDTVPEEVSFEEIDDDTKETQKETFSSSAALPGTYEVRASAQLPGERVFLSSFRLDAPAWIAIREDNEGTPGRILGARFFTIHDSSGEVRLLRATLAGSIYYAVIHADDGDRQFDFTKDLPLRDLFGNMIMQKFDVVQPASPHDLGL